MPILVPISFMIYTFFLVFIPLLTKPRETVGLVLMLCTGVPYYVIFIQWKGKPEFITTWSSKYITYHLLGAEGVISATLIFVTAREMYCAKETEDNYINLFIVDDFCVLEMSFRNIN